MVRPGNLIYKRNIFSQWSREQFWIARRNAVTTWPWKSQENPLGIRTVCRFSLLFCLWIFGFLVKWIFEGLRAWFFVWLIRLDLVGLNLWKLNHFLAAVSGACAGLENSCDSARLDLERAIKKRHPWNPCEVLLAICSDRFWPFFGEIQIASIDVGIVHSTLDLLEPCAVI